MKLKNILKKIRAKLDRVGFCKLCGYLCFLQEGHIVPKFASEWLKQSSATGFLRSPVQVNQRIQDGEKERLLCKKCEVRFSVWENRFREEIFIPFQNKMKVSFSYEEWLLRFAISLAWRTTISGLYSIRIELKGPAEKIIQEWGRLLLSETPIEDIHDHHIFFLDLILNYEGPYPPEGANMYFLRTLDSTPVHGQNELFAYTKLPGIIFWSCIQPYHHEGWEGTLIGKRGAVQVGQKIGKNGFGDFVLKRIKAVEDFAKGMSDRQKQNIANSILKSPSGAFGSHTFTVLFHPDKKE